MKNKTLDENLALNSEQVVMTRLIREIGDRIRQLRHKKSQEAFAREFNLHKNTLNRYETGRRTPSTEFLLQLCQQQKNINPTWILTGKGSKEVQKKKAQQPLTENLVQIPFVYYQPTSPHEALHSNKKLTFDKEWINSFGLDLTNVIAFTVKGDSMKPLIQNGNCVLVDISQTRLEEGSIYVLKFDKQLYPKRIQLNLNGSIRICSDNASYAEHTVDKDDVANLQIFGRVVWCGFKL